jgi:hypothetical protein
MRSDFDIKRDVEDELRSEPDIDPTDIAVAVKDGVVTLTGFVRSSGQKRKAEEDVKRVAGMIGVANNIEVRLPLIHRRPNPDIARDAIEEIKSHLPFSWEKKCGHTFRRSRSNARSRKRCGAPPSSMQAASRSRRMAAKLS